MIMQPILFVSGSINLLGLKLFFTFFWWKIILLLLLLNRRLTKSWASTSSPRLVSRLPARWWSATRRRGNTWPSASSIEATSCPRTWTRPSPPRSWTSPSSLWTGVQPDSRFVSSYIGFWFTLFFNRRLTKWQGAHALKRILKDAFWPKFFDDSFLWVYSIFV